MYAPTASRAGSVEFSTDCKSQAGGSDCPVYGEQAWLCPNLKRCTYEVVPQTPPTMPGDNALTQEGENTVAGGWWALIVIGVLLFAILAALCLFSGKIVRGDCGGWAQKHLTHGNKKIPVLYLAPTDKLDQMAAKAKDSASAEAPTVSPPRAPPALSQPSPSYVEKYKATKPASPNGAAKSAVGANVD